MSDEGRLPAPAEPWSGLRRFTPARVALGRTGASWTTAEWLRFGTDQARARDAVHAPLDADRLAEELGDAGHPVVRVRSAAPDRATYLLRPDLGRRLDAASAAALSRRGPPPEVVIVAADGLSAPAVQRHVPPLLAALRACAARWTGVPVAVALQGRVALGDEVGERLGAALAVVLVGERPGLSSPDSLGIYLTFGPRAGRTDAERNCISNVRPEGLGYGAAARRLEWLVAEALRRHLSGVGLRDESEREMPARSFSPDPE